MKKNIALLRGINVGGHNKMPMAELRELCGELGWEDVRTYIQSGNVVFGSGAAAGALEDALEEGIAGRFGLRIPVVVRTVAWWKKAMNGNPFPRASKSEPNLVMLAASKTRPAKGAVEVLRGVAAHGERVERVGDVLWVHYPAGAARSKLGPAALDRATGSVVTTRNWRTVLKIAEMV